MQTITPFLWFDSQAEEAAKFYVSVFSAAGGSASGGKNSKLGKIARYGKEGQEIHGQKEGAVLTVEFELDGQKFTALNGGPAFKFNESISFMINCETQKEVDYYWEKLSADPKAEQCGWLKDKFGVSWQVVPTVVSTFLSDPDRAKADRVMKTLLPMKKLDIAKLKQAYEGQV